MFREATIRRLERRVSRLQAGFPRYLQAFASAELFSGPSVYFHRRTLDCLKVHRSAVDAVRDDRYLEALYAKLMAWGLHRMGPTNAKLIEFADFCRILRRNADLIGELEPYSISNFNDLTVEQMTRKVCGLVSGVRVSRARTFLVSSSKALHHVLPTLVPPIDNECTLSFFPHSVILYGNNDEEVLRTIFPYFHEVAMTRASLIRRSIGRGLMNTSETKIIDNAIVGFCQKHAV